jgi:hypothetical protein
MPAFSVDLVIFPNLTQLDFTGPLQVLSDFRLRQHIVAKTREGPSYFIVSINRRDLPRPEPARDRLRGDPYGRPTCLRNCSYFASAVNKTAFSGSLTSPGPKAFLTTAAVAAVISSRRPGAHRSM